MAASSQPVDDYDGTEMVSWDDVDAPPTGNHLAMRQKNIEQKARERTLLDAVLRHLEVTAAVENRESPDFLIEIGSRIVGVDVTELYLPSDEGVEPQARESAIARIVAKSRQFYEETGGPPLEVAVGFASRLDPQVRRDDLARQIVDIVCEMLMEPGDYLEWRPSGIDRQRLLPPLNSIRAYRHRDGAPSHWTAPQAGWVGAVRPEFLQVAIDRKAEKLSVYRQSASEIWLICGYLGLAPSQFIELHMDEDMSAVRSPFDRTFVCDGFLSKVREV